MKVLSSAMVCRIRRQQRHLILKLMLLGLLVFGFHEVTNKHKVMLLLSRASTPFYQSADVQLQRHGSLPIVQSVRPEHRPGFAFLKVHKAASTTTQAIFLRYGWTRNLTFVLPPEFNAFGYPNIISLNESLTEYNTLPSPQGKAFNVLCHHVVYGKEAWGKFLPEETMLVGIVREPFSLFKSILNYINPRNIWNINSEDKLGEYLRNPYKYEYKNARSSFTNNRMSFEFGIDPDVIKNRDIAGFKNYLSEVLDKEFDIVIIAERFDESLVLMKRLFSWTLKDILYAMKNVRSVKTPQRYKIGDGFEDLYHKYAIFDYMLYDFFVNKLKTQIKQEGDSFPLELRHFQETRAYVENFCHNVSEVVDAVVIKSSAWDDEFRISREDCDLLHTGEIKFTQMIRKQQYGSANWTWHH